MTIGRFQLLWWWSFWLGVGGWPREKRQRVLTDLYPRGIIFYFIRVGPVELRWFAEASRP